MNEKLQILYMETRLVRLASEIWEKSIEEVNRIFVENDIYHYVNRLWKLFHVEGDTAVLDDIEKYIRNREVNNA